MESYRVSFDPTSILVALDQYDLTWNQKIDLIHYTVVSKVNPNESLFTYINEFVNNLSLSVRKNLLWIMVQYIEEAWDTLPVLPSDLKWIVLREYDLEIQTWLETTTLDTERELETLHLNRFKRYLRSEETEGKLVSYETYKHVEDYRSLLGVNNGNRKSIYRR